MKKQIVFYLWIIASIVNAQSISTYYASAAHNKGALLKMELNHIIRNHTEFSYTSSSTDVWDILKETDKDPENPNNVILIYSQVSVNAAQEYNSGNGWTREHVWAKSRGDFGTDRGPGTDVHHLRPTSNPVNSTRSNRSFANCSSCTDVTYLGQDAGKVSSSEFTYEPIDEVKGDVARMIFYMALRYEGESGEPDLEPVDYIPASTDYSPYHGKLSDLLEWNKLDPVSDFERNRNNIIFTNYQKNRNPFIDFPELADYIFGELTNEYWNPNLALEEELIGKISFQSNSQSNTITILNAEDWELTVFNVLGQNLVNKQLISNSEMIFLPHSCLYIVMLKNGSISFSRKIAL